MAISTMREVTESGTRLDQLRNLALVLAAHIDAADDERSVAQLVRQYRETIKEISELEGDDGDIDEIAAILARRDARKPNAD